jgi:hypothetical protein
LLEQKETKIQERFKMVAAHRGLKAFSMRPALASQRNSKRCDATIAKRSGIVLRNN